MGVRVTVNIDPDLIARRTPRADHILASQAARDTEPFVPALGSALANTTKVDGGKIIYGGRGAPYARYLYYGKLMVDPTTGSPYAKHGVTKVLTNRDLVFNKTVHGDAQDHWFEASKSMNLDKWLRVYKRELADES